MVLLTLFCAANNRDTVTRPPHESFSWVCQLSYPYSCFPSHFYFLDFRLFSCLCLSSYCCFLPRLLAFLCLFFYIPWASELLYLHNPYVDESSFTLSSRHIVSVYIDPRVQTFLHCHQIICSVVLSKFLLVYFKKGPEDLTG